MGNNIRIYNGMPLYDLMTKLANDKVTRKSGTLNYIVNFIAEDKDKKVSNEVERLMLQAWVNGSKKIKRPKQSDYIQIPFNDNGYKFNTYRDKSNSFSVERGKKFDKLVDHDGDGYADYRVTNSSGNYFESDDNLDGKFEERVRLDYYD